MHGMGRTGSLFPAAAIRVLPLSLVLVHCSLTLLATRAKLAYVLFKQVTPGGKVHGAITLFSLVRLRLVNWLESFIGEICHDGEGK